MAYFGSRASCSIQMDKLTPDSTVKAQWVDPRTGESKAMGSFPSSGVQSFATPEGWEDALLILER